MASAAEMLAPSGVHGCSHAGDAATVEGASTSSSSTASPSGRFPSRVHQLLWEPNAPQGGCGGARLLDKQAFAEDLRHYSLAFLRCPAREAVHITRALQEGSKLLKVGQPANATVSCAGNLPIACVYKKQGLQKERVQARRAGLGKSQPGETTDPGTSGQEESILAEAMTVFEELAMAAFEAFCTATAIPFQGALEAFGDLETRPPSAGSGKSKSVLNLYHYFNEEACDEEPCREHADPGLLTVLCRSSNAALEVQLPRAPGGSPGRRADYEEEWLAIEPWMDRLDDGSLLVNPNNETDDTSKAQNTEGGCSNRSSDSNRKTSAEQDSMVLLIAVGETMERLTGSTFPSCSHRVVRTSGLRFNMAYEMRPRHNVWHPWGAESGSGCGSVGSGGA